MHLHTPETIRFRNVSAIKKLTTVCILCVTNYLANPTKVGDAKLWVYHHNNVIMTARLQN